MTEPAPAGVVVGRLEEVELRGVWADEARVFTPWLASHPDYLSEALGMELDLVGTEVAVGPFTADIVLVDSGSGGRVIVENYLEATDHDHLGKLITYASGLEGAYAVLVAKTLRPEHRTALKWLNDISISGTGFFGLEVHAVRIGESLPALRLEVIVEPDDWQRQARQITTGQLSESQARYIEWWSEFLPALQIAHPGWTSASKPQPSGWINLPTGRSGVRYGVSFSWPGGARSYRLRVELYMDDGATWWPILEAHKSAIEEALGPDLVWEPLEDSKASRIAIYLDGADPDDRDAWPAYRSWAIDTLADFRAALQPIITAAVTASPPTPADMAAVISATHVEPAFCWVDDQGGRPTAGRTEGRWRGVRRSARRNVVRDELKPMRSPPICPRSGRRRCRYEAAPTWSSGALRSSSGSPRNRRRSVRSN